MASVIPVAMTMVTGRWSGLGALVLGLWCATGCSASGSGSEEPKWTLTLLTGDRQRAYIATAYSVPLTFRVQNPDGENGSGLSVTLRVPDSGPTVVFGPTVTTGRLATQADGTAVVDPPLAGALQGSVRVEVDVEGAGVLGAFVLHNVGPQPQGQMSARFEGRTRVLGTARAVDAEGGPMVNGTLHVALDGCDEERAVAGVLLVQLDGNGNGTFECAPRRGNNEVVLEPLDPVGPRVRLRTPAGSLARAVSFPVEPAHVVPGGVWPPSDLLLVKDDRDVDLESQLVRVEVVPGPNGAACDFNEGRDIQVAVNAFGALVPDCLGTDELGTFSLRIADATGGTATVEAEVGPPVATQFTAQSVWEPDDDSEGVSFLCSSLLRDARGSGVAGRTVEFTILPESTFECRDGRGLVRTVETDRYGVARMPECGPSIDVGLIVVDIVARGPEGDLTAMCVNML